MIKNIAKILFILGFLSGCSFVKQKNNNITKDTSEYLISCVYTYKWDENARDYVSQISINPDILNDVTESIKAAIHCSHYAVISEMIDFPDRFPAKIENQIKFFEFNRAPGMYVDPTIEKGRYSIYRMQPIERDAWSMADRAADSILKNKKIK